MLTLSAHTSVLSLILLAGSASAQLINRVQGIANSYQRAEDAIALSNGDIALAGESYTFLGGFNTSATLTRADATGVPIWHLAISESNAFPSAFGVRQAPSGDFVLGFFRDFSRTALCVAGVSSSGDVLWVNRYPGAHPQIAAGMKMDTSAGPAAALISTQFSNESPAGGQLLRIDAATGTLIFDRIYTPSVPSEVNDVSFNDVARKPGGDYFVTGSVVRLINGESFDTDLLVARLNASTGATVWAKAIGTPTDPDRGFGYEIGRGIEFAPNGDVIVVGSINDPTAPYGPDAAVHIRFDAATGAMITHSTLPDVQVAGASLDLLTTGQMVSSGTRTFGDGQGAAQMWLFDPVTLNVYWRGEYNSNTSFGSDAIEHLTPSQGLVLVGSHYSSNPIGQPDQMFIRTDMTGNDGCSAVIVIPDQPPVTLLSNDVALTLTLDQQTFAYAPTSQLETLLTNLVCGPAACVGDLNNDGLVDDSDFVIFVFAYNILDCTDPSMPPGCPADFNGDGIVEDTDFVLFVAAYNELICP